MNRCIKHTHLWLILLSLLSVNTLQSQETYLLNYENVEIRKVTQDIARFAKKTIILDPRVKGKVTIYSDALLDDEEVWQVYLRTIQVNGFSSINEGSIVRIVPENEATRDTNIVSNDADFVTKIFLLENRSTSEILPMLKPITGRQSHLSGIASVNSILLVDRKSNVERIEILLRELDKDDTAKISIIKLDLILLDKKYKDLIKNSLNLNLLAINKEYQSKGIGKSFFEKSIQIIYQNYFKFNSIRQLKNRASQKKTFTLHLRHSYCFPFRFLIYIGL